MNTKPTKATVEEEAEYILNTLHKSNLLDTIKYFDNQFNVIISRTQSLLGLITVLISVLGISGAQIIPKSRISGAFVLVGLGFGFLAAISAVLGIFGIRWVTSYKDSCSLNLVIHLINRRNSKTKVFVLSTFLLLLAFIQFISCFIFYYFI